MLCLLEAPEIRYSWNGTGTSVPRLVSFFLIIGSISLGFIVLNNESYGSVF